MKYDVNPITGVPHEYHSTEDVFSDRNTLGPELKPAGTYENMITLGCLCALFVFAAFGVFCTIYLLIKGRP